MEYTSGQVLNCRFRTVRNMLYESMDGEKPEITYKIHKPFKSFGSINIVCRDLVITKTGGFGTAVQLASNCEIYPRTDGNICISLGFNGLTKPIC